MESKVEKKVNEVKAEVKVVNLHGYDFKLSDEVLKKTSELTNEDIDLLPKVPLCTLESVKNRSGSRRYIMKAHFVPNKIVTTINYDFKEFNLLCKSNGIDVDPTMDLRETRISCGRRFIHGVDKNGNEYYAYQLFPYGKAIPQIRRNRKIEFNFLREEDFLTYGLTDVVLKDKSTKRFNEVILFKLGNEVVDSDSLDGFEIDE